MFQSNAAVAFTMQFPLLSGLIEGTTPIGSTTYSATAVASAESARAPGVPDSGVTLILLAPALLGLFGLRSRSA